MTAKRKHRGIGLLMSSFLTLAGCSVTPPPAIPSGAELQSLDTIARHLLVRHQIIDNRPGDHCDPERGPACFIAEITLSSSVDIAPGDWAIYFSHIAPVQKVTAGDFAIEHINGDLHRLVPAPALAGLTAGTPHTVRYIADLWHLSRSDLMPNYYVAAGRDARVIASTATGIDPATGLETKPHAGTFDDSDRHLRRTPGDLTQPATAQTLFDSNRHAAAISEEVATAIIPTPTSMSRSPGGGRLDLSPGVALQLNGLPRGAVAAAVTALADLGIGENTAGVPLIMTLDPALNIALDGEAGAEPGAYRLQLDSKQITVQTGDQAGAANALRSLAALLMPAGKQVPLLQIEDSPRYNFRGLHLDVARNFHSKALVLTLLEQMAVFKLNKLHLHLGDDEGWRLQIDGLAELTDIGSRRCHDLEENRCLLPQLGSGPNANAGVNGYYTADDYIEILRYATARHIQVLPSLDMPGHARAAVKAMEARYRKYLAQGDRSNAERYLLSDPADATRYESYQFYNDNTLNVCMESTYRFIEKVIDEVALLHRRAGQPLTRYHIGADETAGAWLDSPVCEAFINAGHPGVAAMEDLGGYFIERVAAMLAAKGIEAAGWSDGMGHTDPAGMPAVVQSNAWGALFGDGHKSAHEQVNRGWQVIVSTPDVTYFDMPYEADAFEPGYYWASRGTNTRKVFSFMPDNLPVHAEFWHGHNGQPLVLKDTIERDKNNTISYRPMAAGKRFAGLQGHLWSETVRSDADVEYRLFPRLVALAERAWHRADWEVPYDYSGRDYSAQTRFFTATARRQRDRDWARFASIMALKVLPKLDAAGIRYRIPTAGARLVDNHLHTNVIFPGLAVEYRIDGGAWTVWTAPVAVATAAAIEVRVRSADGRRRGRSWALD
ncbi:family 20 glycosylhydrolase [Exilibacterium tricleocarpae]|uniref:beta-N-acetylhexosaminidase n=1 Tax=Exilibacterium tricleocarpae TaxID=2591008 RepID=A0A545TNX9_9GAMM|nr:family 20 glycosylhydrolase [Exilibacterium tricleocarpae]TQV78930.1 family 20 glycosylhydrolase [Exilibacterium tricleocarpae]